jgi:hypothetical protein
MKPLKSLLVMMIIIFVFSNPLANADSETYIEISIEDNMECSVNMCDELYEDYLSLRYYCIISNFYAIYQINNYFYEYRDDQEAISYLLGLLQEFYIEMYDCENFKAIDMRFNEFIEMR